MRADAGAPVPLGGLLLRGGGPRAAAPPAGAQHALYRGQAPAHHQGAPLSSGVPRGQGSTGELWSNIFPLGVDCAIKNGILKRGGLTLGLQHCRRGMPAGILQTCGAPMRMLILCLQCLATGVERGADSAAGWLGLAELQFQERQYEKCYETGVAG